LPKLRDVGEIEKPGVPVPVSVAVSVLPDEATVSVPARAPSAVGVNTTVIWQLAPPATVPQLLEVTTKSPVATAADTCDAKLELFVQVNVCGALG
jgi:hypothetical protein